MKRKFSYKNKRDLAYVAKRFTFCEQRLYIHPWHNPHWVECRSCGEHITEVLTRFKLDENWDGTIDGLYSKQVLIPNDKKIFNLCVDHLLTKHHDSQRA